MSYIIYCIIILYIELITERLISTTETLSGAVLKVKDLSTSCMNAHNFGSEELNSGNKLCRVTTW